MQIMSLFTRLHVHWVRIIDRFGADEEINLEKKIYRCFKEQRAKQGESKAEALKWDTPDRRATSAKTVFDDDFRRRKIKRFWRKHDNFESADAAWNGLSLDGRSHHAALARQNEVYNTREFAKFNIRCPLSPSVEDLRFTVNLGQGNPMEEVEFSTRRSSLQCWNRYRFDHLRACGGALTPVPETPFRIMDLPFEVRREIFVYVLYRPKPVCQLRPDGSADLQGGPIDVRVFAVSRMVFAEAVKVFYEENTFTLKPNDRRYGDHTPLFVSHSTGDQAPRPTNSIKRMHVDLEVEVERPPFLAQIDGNQESWEQLSGFLRSCKSLRKVEIAVWCNKVYHDALGGDIDQKIDGLFDVFRNIRSADEAMFSDATTIDGGTALVSCYRTRRMSGIIISPTGGSTIEESPGLVMAPTALLGSDGE